MATPRDTKTLLDLILTTPSYIDCNLSVQEEKDFIDSVAMTGRNAWEKFGKGAGRYRTEIVTTYLKFTDVSLNNFLTGIDDIHLVNVLLIPPVGLEINDQTAFLKITQPTPGGEPGGIQLSGNRKNLPVIRLYHNDNAIYVGHSQTHINWKLDMAAKLLIVVPSDVEMHRFKVIRPTSDAKLEPKETSMSIAPEPRNPREVLDLILSTPVYSDCNITQVEEEQFYGRYRAHTLDLWEEYGKGDGTYKAVTQSTPLSFTDQNPTRHPFDTTVVYEILEVSLLGPFTLMVNNIRHIMQLATPEGFEDIALSMDDKPGRMTMRHGKTQIQITHSDFPAHWLLESLAVVTVIVSQDVDLSGIVKPNTPSYGKVRKEYGTMKPEFMKKPSVVRHAEHVAQMTTMSWHSNRPALKVGELIVEVDTDQHPEEEVGNLRSEWFWSSVRNAAGARTTVTLDVAVENQNDLIEAANSFIGVRVYHAAFDGTHYHLPLHVEDDLGLLCLLDKTVWSKTETVYPSVVEQWEKEPKEGKHVVVYDLREALMIQQHIHILRVREEQAKAAKPSTRKSTTAKAPAKKQTTAPKRRSRSGSVKVTDN